MNLAIGLSGIVLSLVAVLSGILTIVIGLRYSRKKLLILGARYSWLVLAGMMIATFAMQRALITRDFSVKFVAEQGSSLTPPLFNIATMWSALEGSVLLWGLILAGYLVVVTVKFNGRYTDPMVAWALVVIFFVMGFFALAMIGPANPFQSFDPPIGYDGPGPNPLLQNHILVAFHPPMLYLGFVGFTVPFAFAISALITGRLGEGWLLETRRWTLFAWGFLTAGIILGAWWAYDVLGWGGYWGWDPVENASLVPWLTGTAYIHSVLVQERRGLLRVWNLSLICATFALTILGTFITRSGILASVHAFSAGNFGGWLLVFFSIIVVVAVALIFWRGERLRSPGGMDSPLSREGAFLANNFAFAVFAFVVLLGTVFPLIVEAFQNRQISVGAPYFEKMSMPIGFTLLFLMAVAPLLPWRKAGRELLVHRVEWPAWGAALSIVIAVAVGARGALPLLGFSMAGFAGTSAVRQLALSARRHRFRGFLGRKNGGMVVHIGVILLAVGFIASSSFVDQASISLTTGEKVRIAETDVTYISSNTYTHPNRIEEEVLLEVDGQILSPAVERFIASGQIVPAPDTRITLYEDIQVALLDPPEGQEKKIVIQITRQPMLVWIWLGGLLMLLGTALSLFPETRRPYLRDNIPEAADPVLEKDLQE
ncbi:MAG: cytochrome c-type biogenesis CcmF C-terminal domain-containing protein [Acidimicrobiales bacterium]|nr:cytochrome c-type biogenesis CcmF C-terminal domain-containing protein [Acidimicrobiales bacterium]